MPENTPSLFDDFFFEEEQKEELFPDIPHVYDPEENKKNIAAEDKETDATYAAPTHEIKENTEEENLEIITREEVNLEQGSNLDSPIPTETESNTNNFKKPSLELPESDELEHQLLQEIISSDYASFIHRDYPFNPNEIEKVEPKSNKNKTEIEKTKAPKTANEIENDLIEEEINPETEIGEETAIPLPEWDLNKNYYTIGEVAKLFEVNISHIRFWTNEFKLNPRTTRKGDRLYTPSQINELKLIHYLVKVKKHTIKGAKEKLKHQKETIGSNLQLKESLTELRDLLLDIQRTI